MKTTLKQATLLFGILALGACSSAGSGGGDDGNGNPDSANLTIVGDPNQFMENGWTVRLSVRYHDDDNEPLAGQVDFRISGVSGGALLSSGSSVTNADGVAQVDLQAPATGEAVFKVIAEAAEAAPVEWTVAVSAGAPPLPPLDPKGRYQVNSEFDVVSGLPGTAGDVINGFIEMTDDPYDPATYILDRIQAEIDSGFIEDLLDAARPGLDAIVNDLLMEYSPDFVTDILAVGNKLGQLTRHFGLVSTLDVHLGDGVEGEELMATHTVTGYAFTIDGTRYTYDMADIGLAPMVAEQVTFRMENETKVHVGEHAYQLSYGAMIMIALEEIIIPMVDPFATDIEELLGNLVNCSALGIELADLIGFGSPGLYEGACLIGLSAAASEIENQIRGIDDAGLVLTISGEAKPQDTNTDRNVDVLFGGLWEGTVSYAGTPATLSRPDNTFRGDRMAVP